jgi:hypothetical protein
MCMIYFIQIVNKDKFIKIGYSSNVYARLMDLQVGNPYELVLLATMAGEYEVEDAIHEKFAKYRVRGEWFEPHNKILRYISKNGTQEIMANEFALPRPKI